MVSIREARPDDAEAIWTIFHAVVQPGDTFAFDPETPRDRALAAWMSPPARAYVAVDGASRVMGTYFLKPNQPGLGAHVANAGYMVAPQGRGHGLGRTIGEHSLLEARRLGYRAMQFNFVVSTNEPAVTLWKQLGFAVVGTLPGAFHHRTRGFVDAYVMYKELIEEA